MTVLRDISFLWSMFHVMGLFLLLFTPRYSWRTTLLAGFAGAGTMLCVNGMAMYHLGHGMIMSVAFFTCTIPSLLLLFLLSKYRDGRFFFLFCLTDTVCFWLLQITNFLDRLAGGAYVALLVSRLIVFPAVEFLFWRYLRRPFMELQRKLSKSWWLFAAMGGVYYLLIMATAVPVDAPLPDAAGLLRICLVLLLMPLTYLTIFHSLWRQMQMYENTRQMELQRRDYEAVRQKMELGRIYRHDMRHHLAVLDGLLQQSDAGEARQYVRSLSGGLEELTQPAQCANAAVNAVLTAYIVQAADAGCHVETKLRIPEALPFEETDLCVILANTLENAIHACGTLPEAERRIRLELVLTDNGRLIITVENPSPPVAFGPDGLPEATGGEGHGFGLQSIRTVVSRYGGLLRCQWEAGVFTLRAALMPPEAPAPKKPRAGRTAGIIFCILLCLILLNCIRPLADTLESIPLLGPVVRTVNLQTYAIRWWPQP